MPVSGDIILPSQIKETGTDTLAFGTDPAPAAALSEKLRPDAAEILSQLRTRRKKSKVDLADLEAVLKILEF